MSDIEKFGSLRPLADLRDNIAQASCLYDLVRRTADTVPASPAIKFSGGHLTYADLVAQAEKLAQRLALIGIEHGDVVAVAIPRSFDMIVGLLGILARGAAFVAIDPQFPRERINLMLTISAAKAVVTIGDTKAAFLPAGLLVVDLGEGLDELNRSIDVGGDRVAAAYIAFTSGSTGQPKAVAASHGAVLNYLQYIVSEYGVNDRDTALNISALTFDAAIRDIFTPLAVGGTLVIPAQTATRDIEPYEDALRSGEISAILSITPSLLGLLCDQLSQEDWSRSVRLILVSGEIFEPRLLGEVRRVFGTDAVIVNQYGPTECTMTTTYFPIPRDFQGEIIPVGKPINNAFVHLLDTEMREVANGVVGEIFIGGPGVARGYLGRPDLTAERFVASPFHEGDLLFRTGDQARIRGDGQLIFLGRADQQIKIRGNRIEPGEVETALARHPSVHHAAVLARVYGNADSARLVAYVVPAGDFKVDTDDLRSFLQEILPDYMIPSAVVTVQALPLSVNGKLDRSALPDPENPRGIEQVLPRTGTERVIAEIWQDVLKVAPIGVHETFFELGGHSLMAMRLHSRIQRHFQVKLPLPTIFEFPTIEKLAAVVDAYVTKREQDIFARAQLIASEEQSGR
ncbi:non-ribosomal peptide synthetase [Rhizobium sp. ZPR3]|uniref:Non-ribosomal peptide synthetase n=2 Tax=unclassified Rhizobium TaxID=2613769 RepID=A0AAU7SA33_9HYPH